MNDIKVAYLGRDGHRSTDGNAFLLVEYRWVWWSVTL
jgi:hypothetical protein